MSNREPGYVLVNKLADGRVQCVTSGGREVWFDADEWAELLRGIQMEAYREALRAVRPGAAARSGETPG